MFTDMTKVVPEGASGIAKVEHFDVSRSASMLSAMRRDYVPEGRYARLYVGGQLMMSDTPMEHRSNVGVVRHANGHVLIAGLGLGMVLHPILKKSEVRSVWIIEKCQDVINLIAPHFKPRRGKALIFQCADIFEWKPPLKDEKFDTIYFDIWPDKCLDNLKEIAKLHQRFKNYLNRENPNRWMSSWARDELLSRKRSEARGHWW